MVECLPESISSYLANPFDGRGAKASGTHCDAVQSHRSVIFRPASLFQSRRSGVRTGKDAPSK